MTDLPPASNLSPSSKQGNPSGFVIATVIMFFVEVIPPILLGPVAGIFVDREFNPQC